MINLLHELEIMLYICICHTGIMITGHAHTQCGHAQLTQFVEIGANLIINSCMNNTCTSVYVSFTRVCMCTHDPSVHEHTQFDCLCAHIAQL